MEKINREYKLSINKQCELLSVNRSSFYYVPLQVSLLNNELKKLIDKQYLGTPFYGVPRMIAYLKELGHKVNPKRIRHLYQLMGNGYHLCSHRQRPYVSGGSNRPF